MRRKDQVKQGWPMDSRGDLGFRAHLHHVMKLYACEARLAVYT